MAASNPCPVVVTADDMGICAERDLGILEGHAKGIVTSSSLLVNGCSAQSAVSLAKNAGLPLGLHLNLTEGPPVSAAADVPSLLLECQSWWPGEGIGTIRRQFRGKSGLRDAAERGQICMEEVALEVEAQLLLFKQLTGSFPVHMDGHQHCHVLPGIAAVVARVAASCGVALVRIPHEEEVHFAHVEPESRRRFYTKVSSQAKAARCIYAEEGLVSPSFFAGFGMMGRDLTMAVLRSRVARLCEDVSVVVRERHVLQHAMTQQTESRAHADNIGDQTCDAEQRSSEMEGGEGRPPLTWLTWPSGGWERHGADSVCEVMCHVGLASSQGVGDEFCSSPDREWELLVWTSEECGMMLKSCGIQLVSAPSVAAAAENAKVGDGGWWRRAFRSIEQAMRYKGQHTDGWQHTDQSCPAGSESDSVPAVAAKGRLLVLTSCTEATGNGITASRLCSVARSLGWSVDLRDVHSFQEPQELHNLLQHHHVDAVVGIHAHRAGRLLIGASIPYCILLGGTDVNLFVQDEDKRATMSEALRGCCCVISFSESMLDKLKDSLSYSGPTVLMPQAVEIPTHLYGHPTAQGGMFSDIARLSGCMALDAKVFLLPSGLRKVKDPAYLVEAFKEWHREDASVWLLIVGPCLDEECARQLFRQMLTPRMGLEAANDDEHSTKGAHEPSKDACCQGSALSISQDDCFEGMGSRVVLGEGVVYHPPVQRGVILSEMSQARAVLNCSQSEGMSNTLLEAMASGTPVIARAVPGNLELVRHGRTGLLYSTPSECVRQCKQLLLDNGLASRLSSAASVFLSLHHSQEAERRAFRSALDRMVT